MTPPRLHVVGTSVARTDGVGHVTGRTRFTTDRTFPGMLHLKMVRSPLDHALIRGIDLSAAERVPGFVGALTAKDVPEVNLTWVTSLQGEAIVAILPRPRRRRSRRSPGRGSTSRSSRPCSTSRRPSRRAPRS